MKRDHHEPIVSRDDFIAVQRMIRNAKHRNKGFLPELTVITSGLLQGYIPVNPRWAGFTVEDYHNASQTVTEDLIKIPSKPLIAEPKQGDFDLRGYEIARGQFFSNSKTAYVSLSRDKVVFSKTAIQRLENKKYIELLVHPGKRIIAVCTTEKNNRNSIQWCMESKNGLAHRIISAAAFMPVLFELFDWDQNCRYRIIGTYLERDAEKIMLFNASDAEMFIPKTNHSESGIKKRTIIHAYPAEWVEAFGPEYYSRETEILEHSSIENWETDQKAQTAIESDIKTTEMETVRQKIDSIVQEMKEQQNG